MNGSARTAVVAVALLACAARAAGDAPNVFELRSALKGSFLLSRARETSLVQPDEVTTASFWRVRLEPRLLPTSWLTVFAAYEQRVRVASAASALSAPGLPPSDARAPFRVVALEGPLSQGAAYSYWHEVDRLALSFHLPHLELTVGRQALGWGRGLSFGAVDFFSPFTPLEVDREWRRGVDAVRAEVSLGQRASVEAVAVFSDALERSAFVGRARGFFGPVDAELVGGWRAKDVVLGATVSAALFDAEVHGEVAAFVLPTPWPHGGTFGCDRLVLKAVAGASYQFPVGDGLRAALEYYYSGFGLTFPVDARVLALDTALHERLARGDLQILSRQVLAASASYAFDMTFSGALQVLVDPIDGSGVVAPAVTWDVGDNVTLVGAAYAGWGALPRDFTLRTQLGATPLTVFLQLRVYDQRAVAPSRPPAAIGPD